MGMINELKPDLKTSLTKIIGNNVYKYRIESGMTQEELAEKVGIGASFVARIESGQKIMSVPVLYGLAKSLCVGLDMLLSEEVSTSSIEKLAIFMKDCPPDEVEKIGRLLRTSLSIVES